MTDAGAFWTWSVELYGRPAVAEACLALQDRHGLDVNLLLLGLWLATRGETVPSETATELASYAETWQREVVRPLRAVRRSLKVGEADPAVAALRHDVAAAELEAEHVEQVELERRVRDRTCNAPATRATAEASWRRLIVHATLDPPSTLALLEAVFGGEGSREGRR